MISSRRHPASFRDPSGYIFENAGQLYRQVNQVYATNYRLLIESGLFRDLVSQNMLISHDELAENLTGDPQWALTLLPSRVDFISYPYEWCFSQWKRAALLTLDVLSVAMDHGMVLKDATPFNIQFRGTQPVFIDTLSFEAYDAELPWVAYRQFMECFIAPMLLAKFRSVAMLRLFELYPEGIPLAELRNLLPFRSRFSANVFLHVFLPGMVQEKAPAVSAGPQHFSQAKLRNIIANLRSWTQSLESSQKSSHWSRYYGETILSEAYAQAKMAIVKQWLGTTTQQAVLDLGTNTGWFAQAAADLGKQVVAVDADSACVDSLYRSSANRPNLLPLVLDITKPSPAIGWMNEERSSFSNRVRSGLTLALALIHHLSISGNISFDQMAASFADMSEELIIEFIPKCDPKVQLLLAGRKDIFSSYDESCFTAAFASHWDIVERIEINASQRVLYYMKRRPS